MSYNDPYRPSGFGHLPVITKNILIINVLLFALTTFLQQTQHIDLTKYLGLHYYSAPDFRPHQLITYLFMHGGLTHILFNMLGVYIFGQVLEQLWGPKRFLTFYILTGLGAALAQYIIIHFSIGNFIDQLEATQNNLTLDSFLTFVNSADFQINLYSVDGDFGYMQNFNEIVKDNPGRALSLASRYLVDFKNAYLNSNVIVGASGSLFGLLGAFGMLFPNRLLYLYFFIPVKAKWLVIGYGALELFSGISNRPGDNVAHFAHLGGLFVGLIIVLIWRRGRSHFY
jgi:membrane associated rhomboid family serine protease